MNANKANEKGEFLESVLCESMRTNLLANQQKLKLCWRKKDRSLFPRNRGCRLVAVVQIIVLTRCDVVRFVVIIIIVVLLVVAV